MSAKNDNAVEDTLTSKAHACGITSEPSHERRSNKIVLNLVLIHRKLSGRRLSAMVTVRSQRQSSRDIEMCDRRRYPNDVFRNFPPKQKMAAFSARLMISVQLQLIFA